MSDKLSEFYEELDTILEDIEQEAEESIYNIEDSLNEVRNIFEDQEAIQQELSDQDYRIGVHFLARYYNTEFEDEEQKESAEAHIDTLFIRNGREAPFQDLNLPRAEVQKQYTRPSFFSENPLEGFGGLLYGDKK